MPPYQTELPEMFPYTIDATPEEIQHLVPFLMQSRPGAAHGSSFAVTSEAGRNLRRLWLSETSFQTLIGMNIVPRMFEAKTASKQI